MSGVVLKNIRKSYGAVDVIHGVDLEVQKGEFIVFVGPSGCGKSTLLRMIAGLEEITSGEMFIDGVQVNDMPPSKRGIAMVFQSFSLYPHMTVYENIAFPLRATRMSKTDVDTAVREIARVLRITEMLARRPSALSGGDMQRVAIGRALVRRPKAMLMDEPIGALDAKLREEMRAEIKRLHIKQGSTTIYVTHDQVEAMALADRIVIMHEGILQQVGSPSEVYSYPSNTFVAQFVGSPVMNMAEARVADSSGRIRVGIGGLDEGFEFPAALGDRLSSAAGQNGNLTLGVRPEGVLVSRDRQEGYMPVEAHIIEPLGSHDIVDLKVGDAMLRARTKSGFVPGPGEPVWARIDPAQAHFFNTATGLSLGIRL